MLNIFRSAKASALDFIDATKAAPPLKVLQSFAALPSRQARAFVGTSGNNFLTVGFNFLSHAKALADMKPSHRILDVGCGIGRIAIPLVSYLDKKTGSYEGFDIVPEAIQWCQANITPRHPTFRFQHADICNTLYNPHGKLTAQTFRFPYADAEFDRVILTSVFTHMLQAETQHYLAEIRRVLKPGGKSLITWFILNEQSERGIANGASSVKFAHKSGDCLILNPSRPDDAVAYKETSVRDLYAQNRFELFSIHYGSWSGRDKTCDFQDICIAG